MPLPVVNGLRELGHDVLTVAKDGKANQRYPDALVLCDAAASDRAVVTLNRRHFRRLHDEDANHSGTVLCTYDPDFALQAQRIHEALTTTDTLAGHLLRVNRRPD